MLSDSLIRHTILRFPNLSGTPPEVEPLEKGGSDRRYYRVHFSAEHSLILVKYGDQKEENRHYVEIAQFLASNGLRVPRIFFHDESEGLIWMQDLGGDDLWSFRNQPWPKLRRYYQSALEEAAILHQRAHERLPEAGVTLQTGFNEELYLWEQNYFFEHCLGGLFQLGGEELARRTQREALQQIAKSLAAEPQVLVHRDFQSQNIMILQEQAFLIDFQGLRFGLAGYDLASLLYDPYVALTTLQRQELLQDYIAKAGDDTCLRHFDRCALQRLMQALGAYGFLGLVKGRTHFLQHVPAALASLREVVGRIAGLDQLGRLLEELPGRPTIVALPGR